MTMIAVIVKVSPWFITFFEIETNSISGVVSKTGPVLQAVNASKMQSEKSMPE